MAGWMSKVALTNRLPDFSKLPGESPMSSSSTEVEVNSQLLSASEVTHKLLVAVNMSFQTGVAFQFQVKQFISFLPCFWGNVLLFEISPCWDITILRYHHFWGKVEYLIKGSSVSPYFSIIHCTGPRVGNSSAHSERASHWKGLIFLDQTFQ